MTSGLFVIGFWAMFDLFSSFFGQRRLVVAGLHTVGAI